MDTGWTEEPESRVQQEPKQLSRNSLEGRKTKKIAPNPTKIGAAGVRNAF